MTEGPRLLQRLLAGCVLLFVALAAGAAALRTDVVVTGQGRLVPEGRIALVQPQTDGRVIAVHVADGDRVARGDLLAELDPRALRAELNILDHRHAALLAEDQRLITQLDVIAGRMGVDAARTATDGTGQRDLITSVLHQRARDLAVYDIRISGLRDALDGLVQQAALLEREAALRDDRLTALRTLQDRGAVSSADMLDAQAARLRISGDIAAVDAERTRLQAALAEAEAERRSVDARLETEWLLRRKEIAALADEQAERIASLRAQLEAMQIRATGDGIVTDLAQGFQGRALMRGETVMRIVPEAGPLIAEIDMTSQDIGFVRLGQSANLKIDAFPFQRFGVVPATVTYVSADAQSGADGSWTYRVRLSLDAADLSFVDELRSGMTARADLIVGERRLVTYLLGPILRMTGESFREI